MPRKTKVINPDTGRPVKVGGEVWRKLVKAGKITDPVKTKVAPKKTCKQSENKQKPNSKVASVATDCIIKNLPKLLETDNLEKLLESLILERLELEEHCEVEKRLVKIEEDEIEEQEEEEDEDEVEEDEGDEVVEEDEE